VGDVGVVAEELGFVDDAELEAGPETVRPLRAPLFGTAKVLLVGEHAALHGTT
jgi:hypothetical protein